jgi:phosphopantothenoylcysteine decarboxylase/phosphopantothenate--cysteine ligase
MEIGVAEEAARRGAGVTLVLAPAEIAPAGAIRVVPVETAAEMAAAVAAEAPAADVVVMAAAVSDYRPAGSENGKRGKSAEPWQVTLEPTADILAGLGATRRPGQVLIGFAAEHGTDVSRARAKLERKAVDMIVMNDVSRTDIGFGADDNELILVTSKGETPVPRRSKRECATAIWDAAPLPIRTDPEPAPV